MLDARYSHLNFCQSLNRLQRGLSAIAELLVSTLNSETTPRCSFFKLFETSWDVSFPRRFWDSWIFKLSKTTQWGIYLLCLSVKLIKLAVKCSNFLVVWLKCIFWQWSRWLRKCLGQGDLNSGCTGSLRLSNKRTDLLPFMSWRNYCRVMSYVQLYSVVCALNVVAVIQHKRTNCVVLSAFTYYCTWKQFYKCYLSQISVSVTRIYDSFWHSAWTESRVITPYRPFLSLGSEVCNRTL